jgi:hypothetical protein
MTVRGGSSECDRSWGKCGYRAHKKEGDGTEELHGGRIVDLKVGCGEMLM